MSALFSGYISIETLEKIVATLKIKKENGFRFTGSISDESKEFNTDGGKKVYQNVSLYAEQTKEQREAKANRFYFSNGGVFWNDGKIVNAGPKAGTQAAASTAPAAKSAAAPSAEDLPF